MILELGADAQEYGQAALRAFEAAGGDSLVVRAAAEPTVREDLVAPVLRGLGAFDLRPRADADELEAAAALCRSAGYWALPYPVAECLSAPADPDADSADDDALGLVLGCWTLLGMLDRAMDLTVAHVRLREQFGQPLAKFQGVQFQLTDAEVERSGLDMLAKYALWSIATGRPEAVDDALATRMAATEAAEVVFRVCHQLHGAVGFCDETALSWLSRYSQPLRRLPWGISGTRDRLVRRVGKAGLRGLYA